LHRWRR